MPRTPQIVDPLIIIDPTLPTPVWRQIYDRLREAVVSGRLRPGARLPASRVLATQVVVSRNSVTAAYDQLRAEGYLEHRERRGTFVASALPDLANRPRIVPRPMRAEVPPVSASATRPRLSGVGTVAVAAAERISAPDGARRNARGASVPFRIFEPALDAFPTTIWARLLTRRWRSGRVPLGYSEPTGVMPLREALAAYLGNSRGVRCVPDQIFITSGTQQAAELATRLVLSPGDGVWVEHPGYLTGPPLAMRGSGAQVVPVPVDHDGLRVEEGMRIAPNARAAYVTPSHQFPLGSVMSVARRLALLEWARQRNAWIFEDDYDSEFRFASRPLPSLQSLDDHNRVIYIGTFSKTLFPAIRLAYVVAPLPLVDAFEAACVLGGGYASPDTQLVVADFIVDGHFERHLRRMRTLYAARQEALVSYAREYLAEWLTVTPSAAGLHLVAWLNDGAVDARTLLLRAAEVGVEVRALSNFTELPLERDAALLGYGPFDSERMKIAAQRLARALGSSRVPATETLRAP